MFGKGADIVGAGNGVPRGAAREVDGGYMIKGHWSYGSGIQHAEWIHSGCFIMDGDKMRMTPDGAPDIVLCHHPRDTIVLKGNWDTLGLRGTGSYDYTLKDAEMFVPSHMTYKFNGAVPQRGGIQYSAGLVTITTWGHTGWALGVGRRTLDELAKMCARPRRCLRQDDRQRDLQAEIRRSRSEIPRRARASSTKAGRRSTKPMPRAARRPCRSSR